MIKKKNILIAGFVLSIFAVATEASARITVEFSHISPVHRRHIHRRHADRQSYHYNRCRRDVYYPVRVRTCYPEYNYIPAPFYVEPFYAQPCRHDDYDYYPRRSHSYVSFGFFGW